MVAVLLSKSTRTALTPGTFSNDFLTVTEHSGQVMFCTASVTVSGGAANTASGSTARMAISKWRIGASFQ
ncbi:hypothetical protein D9M71_801100 [compost metagenome]